MEDRLIIELFFERSEQGITELSKKYGTLCRSLSNQILRNAQDAEECVNDAFLAAWNTIPPARPDPLSAYICRITRNISLKKYHSLTAQKRNSRYDIILEEVSELLTAKDSVEDELSRYSVQGYFVTCSDLIEGNWQVSFPIENMEGDGDSDTIRSIGRPVEPGIYIGK